MSQKQIAVGCHARICPGGHDITPPGGDQQIDRPVEGRLGVVAHHGGDVGLGVEQEFLDIVPALRGHAGLKALIGYRHGAGDPPQLFRVGLPQMLLELHIAGIPQGPGKPDHTGLADLQLLGELRGGHKAGVGLMVQNERADPLAGFGELCLAQLLSQLSHGAPLLPDHSYFHLTTLFAKMQRKNAVP